MKFSKEPVPHVIEKEKLEYYAESLCLAVRHKTISYGPGHYEEQELLNLKAFLRKSELLFNNLNLTITKSVIINL